MIKGTINCKEDEAAKILADQIFPLEGYSEESLNTAIKLKIPIVMDEEAVLREIKDILLKHPGDTPVLIYLESARKCLKAETSLWVAQ